MKKVLLIAFVLLGLFVAGYYEYVQITSGDLFTMKDSHDTYTRNFVNHESEFADLYHFFKRNFNTTDSAEISFEFGKGDSVSLTVQSAGKKVEAINVPIHSANLDAKLAVYGWVIDSVKVLKDKLSKVHCNYIIRKQLYGQYATQIWPDAEGGTYYTYYISDTLPADSIASSHGGPISNSDFGKHVFLDFSGTYY